jgi:hypothetical protein
VRLLGQIILVCLVISALQGLVAVLAITILLALLISLLVQPERTVGLMALGLLCSGLFIHPWLTIGFLGFLLVVVLIADVGRTADQEASEPKRLTDQCRGANGET